VVYTTSWFFFWYTTVKCRKMAVPYRRKPEFWDYGPVTVRSTPVWHCILYGRHRIRYGGEPYLNFAPAAYHRHRFRSVHGQNRLASSHVWQNFSIVTVLQARWRNKNFVRRVTVMEVRRFDQNSTVLYELNRLGSAGSGLEARPSTSLHRWHRQKQEEGNKQWRNAHSDLFAVHGASLV
jgi:hypothetical protein